MSGPAVELKGVTKRFGDVAAVQSIDLEIGDGEFFSLLGPSGCGKTTTLRMIAGFDYPTEGSLKINGEEMGLLPANQRPVNTVFQSYALFPHMDVADNVAFGLQMRKVPAAEVTERVSRVLDQVQLRHRADARPSQLSGGQRQRVALARALVNEPEVLLLDEPLGALDLKLRQNMQVELKDLQARVGITFVYVTHDQEEALTMSDRIGVMNEGRLLQVGDPSAIYEHPASRFVAGFIGDINLLPAAVTAADVVKLSNGIPLAIRTQLASGSEVTLALRPERLELYDPGETIPDHYLRLPGKVSRKLYYGDAYYYDVEVGLSAPIEAKEENRPGVETYDLGDETIVAWDPASTNVVQD